MASVLKKLPIPPGLKRAVIFDKKSAGSVGGTFTSGAWRTRDLNTIEGDTDFISVSSNQFTLQPGSYLIHGSCPAREVDNHQCRLYDITNSSVIVEGSSEDADVPMQTRSHLFTQLEVASATVFELQHQCQTTSPNTSGMGAQSGSSSGQEEMYANMIILKL